MVDSILLIFRMETFYRVMYSVVVNWRTLLMMTDTNPLSIIGIGKEIHEYLMNLRAIAIDDIQV